MKTTKNFKFNSYHSSHIPKKIAECPFSSFADPATYIPKQVISWKHTQQHIWPHEGTVYTRDNFAPYTITQLNLNIKGFCKAIKTIKKNTNKMSPKRRAYNTVELTKTDAVSSDCEWMDTVTQNKIWNLLTLLRSCI